MDLVRDHHAQAVYSARVRRDSCAAVRHAESAFPGPADASASVPVVTVPPAFAEYRRYDNSDAVEWIRLNRALAPGRGESAAPSRSKRIWSVRSAAVCRRWRSTLGLWRRR
ncbi:unnamed protein product [Mycetohabitans rhizoxinica HKI 454]|uniref:Uncharacterized protein n=1 Tax=Mycetohabitans rhizoxinica (strain DSM 19002 / CIP 109453 / HKI 454) TaxID=882378 RepID=E5AR50_MYCRK|nr:unnamed protein product [Mycetohabitans rhizoxinica HKI 454]